MISAAEAREKTQAIFEQKVTGGFGMVEFVVMQAIQQQMERGNFNVWHNFPDSGWEAEIKAQLCNKLRANGFDVKADFHRSAPDGHTAYQISWK